MRGESPLVVAQLPVWRKQLIMGLRILHLVLLCEAQRARLCFSLPLLQLQLPRVRGIWPVDRDRGLSHGLRFCAPHI